MNNSPIEYLWASPVMIASTGTGDLAGELRELILSCENDDFRKKNSPQRPHDGVFESEFDFLKWQDERVVKLRNLMYGLLGSFVKEVNQFTDDELNQLKFDNHCWFHITRSGGYFQPHNHPNASWSMIYCVDPGDERPVNDSVAGSVSFTDPRQTNSYLDPANRFMRREASFQSIRHRFNAADVAIFPSYLYHYVEPYQGERPRITVAANFWFGRHAYE